MADTLKTWLATVVVAIGVLILCGWLDEPPAPTGCVAEIRDAGGNVHYISGQIAQISTH